MRQVSQIGITALSIGELLTCFKGGPKEEKHIEEMGGFLDSPRVVIICIDEDTAEFYSAILTNLKKKGTPIPTNDIWIAAVAFQHGLPLFTYNKHFQNIDGLLLR